jgi:hypothetical protein
MKKSARVLHYFGLDCGLCPYNLSAEEVGRLNRFLYEEDQKFKIRIKNKKNLQQLMSFSRPIQWYHSHADIIWPDGAGYILRKFTVMRVMVTITGAFIFIRLKKAPLKKILNNKYMSL